MKSGTTALVFAAESPEPSPEPPAEPSPEPTAEPSPEPTAEPSPEPTAEPSPEPTAELSPVCTVEQPCVVTPASAESTAAVVGMGMVLLLLAAILFSQIRRP